LPTIIDSLIVTLGLDSKDMDSKSSSGTKKLKDLEDQSKKTESGVKKIGATSKESAAGVETLTRTMGGFLALIGGTMAIKAFISDFIEANAALYRFSQNLGLSVSTISAWSNASEELGGSAAGLQGTLDMLSKSQTELRLTGQSSLIPYFSALGVSLATVGGQARPVDEILLSLADRFSKMDRTTANNMGRMMGIDQGTMNLLLKGRTELELTIKRQKESTAVTKAQAEAAQKLQTQIVDIKQKFTALGNSLMLAAAPALEKLLSLLSSFGDWVSANKQFVTDFLTVLAVGMGAIAIAALPLTGTVAAVMALAAAIALLWDDYQTWKKGGDSFIDWAVWERGITAATNGIKALKSAIDGVIGSYTSWYEKTTGHKFSVGDLIDSAKAVVGITPSGKPGGGQTTSAQAKAEAARVSQMTGIPADILWAQWAHETGNFTNRGAKDLNNLAGVNVPGGKGQDYRKFSSLDEFGDYYAHLMRPGGRYSGAANAKTPEEFAAALKAGGYYSDSQSNYAGGIQRYMNGIQGASSSVAAAGSSPAGAVGSSTDASVTNHIGEIKVYTAATDAHGIAHGMDFLFTSQGNTGLN
jgi:flagellum-specific peptidoglycan hydrolase FlgJ